MSVSSTGILLMVVNSVQQQFGQCYAIVTAGLPGLIQLLPTQPPCTPVSCGRFVVWFRSVVNRCDSDLDYLRTLLEQQYERAA
jgi:hypothetical protein